MRRLGRASIDERALGELIEQSADLQVDALKEAKASLPHLRELGRSRRAVLRTGGVALAGTTLGLSGALPLTGRAATAQTGDDVNLDVSILQTAASLESLAIATYEAALGLPFIANGNPVVKTFAMTTRKQHDEHRAAFNSQAKALGGKEQMTPNKVLAPGVEAKKPMLKTPADVVTLAAELEQVATDTYLKNLTQLGSKDVRLLMASVMGVESQHLATLRAVGALLAGGGEALIAIPTDAAKLPAAAGSVAFPESFEPTAKARDPREGEVK